MDNAFSASWLIILGVSVFLTLIVTVPWVVTLVLFHKGMLAEWREQRKQKRTGHDTAVPPRRT